MDENMGGRSRTKKDRDHPIVQIIALENMTEGSMKKSIQDLIGEPPVKVQILGQGVYRLKFNDYHLAKKLLAFHSREITGCPRPLQISLVEQQFTALEIFDMLHDKLANREKVDTYHQPNEKPVREVHADPPPTSKSAQGGKGGGASKGGGGCACISSSTRSPIYLFGRFRPAIKHQWQGRGVVHPK
jgi:hypothetical protein